eukprot:1893678-Pyramimonas_sp.AAC.1
MASAKSKMRTATVSPGTPPMAARSRAWSIPRGNAALSGVLLKALMPADLRSWMMRFFQPAPPLR